MWGIELSVMLVMIGVNSVFAAYEIALASVSLARLQTLAAHQLAGAASAVRMKRRMESSLAVVQLGITLVGVIAAATGGAGAQQSIEPLLKDVGFSPGASQFLAILFVALPLTVLTIVLGELVPKVFALRHKERVCLRLSPVMEWFAGSVRPAVWGLEKSVSLIMRWADPGRRPQSPAEETAEEHALQELRAVAALARTSRLIGLREEAIIMNAARLTSIPVRQAMLPARFIAMLNMSDSLEQNLIAAHKDMHTRFPVTRQASDPQSIVGYVNFKDLVAILRMAPSDPSLRGILRPLQRVSESLRASECLELMIHERSHIALVEDAGGKIVGMLTLEDILEELVGEIHDEYDRLPTTIVRSGDGWVAGGHASLETIRKQTGLQFSTDDMLPAPETLNDWVVGKLGKPVAGGEIIYDKDVRLVVRKVRRQLVQEAQIGRNP